MFVVYTYKHPFFLRVYVLVLARVGSSEEQSLLIVYVLP